MIKNNTQYKHANNKSKGKRRMSTQDQEVLLLIAVLVFLLNFNTFAFIKHR